MISSEETNWLHSIIDISLHEESTQKIHFHIPDTLVESTSEEDYQKYYEHRVVSIGPFHYGRPHVEPMEKFKRKAVRELLLKSLNQDCSDELLASVEQVYKSVEQDLLSAQNFYDMSRRDTISDSEWCQMIFRDACFIIYFITSDKRTWLNNMKKRNRHLVGRDILLLENQLPFQVLIVLACAFKCKEFRTEVPIPHVFIQYISHVFFRYGLQQGDAQHPVHLLQYYRNIWVKILFKDDINDEEEEEEEESDIKEDHPPFSVTELKIVGIRCSCAKSIHSIFFSAKDIHLKPSMLSGTLFLPQLIIDEGTMTFFYNLVAYEYSCSLEYTSFGILSYLSFMSMLINGEEDVKELRARGVIQINLKFGDDQVVNFLRDITAHYEPSRLAFKDVKRQLSTYFKSKNLLPLRVGYAEFKQRYFSGPWSFLVFLAVIFTVSMTVIQTVFTGIQTYKKN
ncbi:hypothetical protein KY285_019900 [Solanum tuberosum]|nr:hypothetical protein KY289_020118 [Solanum tuberosum]KAH0692803.1 hypothetical protein KY285_019900 [Solanum tuberosum]